MRTGFFLAIATCLVAAELQSSKDMVSRQQINDGQPNADYTSTYYSTLRSRSHRVGTPVVKRSKPPHRGIAKAVNDPYRVNWWTEVQLGNQTVELMLDTGSSDTWVLREGFENFNVSYASGEFLVGQVEYESVTLAGITVPKQEIGLIDYAYWPAGATGLLGLAWPALTRAFNGTNSTEDGDGDPAHQELHYRSFFATMIADKLISPVFSIALAGTNSENSYIAFGGLSPVKTYGTFVSSPMLLDPHYSPTDLSVYYIAIDEFFYEGYTTTNATSLSGTAIVDSGSVTINAPTEIADAYAKLFNPPAISPPDLGIYIIECDAKPPSQSFSVTINGTQFDIPGSDLVLSDAILSENGLAGPYGNYCFCGMQSGSLWGENTYLLGRPFLENVVAVHDLGAREMRFAQRKY